MIKNFDELFPGAWAGEMTGSGKDGIQWFVGGELRVNAYVEMRGVFAKETIMACVRRHNGNHRWTPSNRTVYVLQKFGSEIVCGFHVESTWGAIVSSSKAPENWMFGGPIIRNWGTHVMRSDVLLRKAAGYPHLEQEAYSLFRQDGSRLSTLTGSVTWAMKKCEDIVAKDHVDVLHEAVAVS